MVKIERETASEGLLKFIHEKGLTQKKVAEDTRLTEKTISNIIGGQRPNALTLYKINQYLSTLD